MSALLALPSSMAFLRAQDRRSLCNNNTADSAASSSGATCGARAEGASAGELPRVSQAGMERDSLEALPLAARAALLLLPTAAAATGRKEEASHGLNARSVWAFLGVAFVLARRHRTPIRRRRGAGRARAQLVPQRKPRGRDGVLRHAERQRSGEACQGLRLFRAVQRSAGQQEPLAKASAESRDSPRSLLHLKLEPMHASICCKRRTCRCSASLRPNTPLFLSAAVPPRARENPFSPAAQNLASRKSSMSPVCREETHAAGITRLLLTINKLAKRDASA